MGIDVFALLHSMFYGCLILWVSTILSPITYQQGESQHDSESYELVPLSLSWSNLPSSLKAEPKTLQMLNTWLHLQIQHLTLHPNAESRVEPKVKAEHYSFSETRNKFKTIPLQEHVQSSKVSSSKSKKHALGTNSQLITSVSPSIKIADLHFSSQLEYENKAALNILYPNTSPTKNYHSNTRHSYCH